MGSITSKSAASASNSTSRALHSSCFGHHRQVSAHKHKETGSGDPCMNQGETESDQVKIECGGEVKVQQANESSNNELDEWSEEARDTNAVSRAARPMNNHSSRCLSRFSFFPGNLSFRLSRTSSLGSSTTNFTISHNEEVVGNRDEARWHSGMLPACFISRSPPPNSEVSSSSNQWLDTHTHTPTSGFDNSRTGIDVRLRSPRNQNNTENNEMRLSDRRILSREPVESNVRFSRTMSVGRLRDRVLRRSSFSEREIPDATQGASASQGNVIDPPTTSSYSLQNGQEFDVETSRSREGRYHNLLEHRSNFLERRRRIRSQVRALQRLGGRFENLSGHERSCILLGQHRTGRCTCRTSSRDANSNDDTSARASISRIVMLAEALFEVLDEIHQQSVVLSSRSSVSSIGSVPAPNEVVESLPLKLFSRLPKHQHEEAAQCYICLVEYDEGDCMRILPCHHEFHSTCIDKWLKEIHRVCPVCRGDICRSN